ncbi:MAG: hypothetical protein AAGF12_26930 [Myxococcota bacterium]
MRAALSVFLWVILALLPAFAAAQADPEVELRTIREQVLYADYDGAITGATAFLARTDLTAAQRNRGLEALATAHIANRDDSDARQILELLYSRDPRHRLTDADAGPRVQSLFARVREAGPTPVPVQLQVRATPSTERRAPTVEARIVDNADAVQEIRVRYRQGGEPGFTTVTMNRGRDGISRARIPLLDGNQAYEVGFIVQALSPSLHPLATLGSEAEPQTLQVVAGASSIRPPWADDEPPPNPNPTPVEDEGTSVFATWWFWTLVAAAVGGGVAAYFLLGPPSEGPAEGSLGSVTLQL